jgi:hypothetical protein
LAQETVWVASKSACPRSAKQPADILGSLAYAEMRLILARMIFNFDIKLADPDFNWLDQKAYFLWSKLPLEVYLTPVTKNEQQR